MAKLLEDLLSRKGLAGELGVCERTIIRWQNRPGGIPHIKLGNRVLYRRESVEAWLKAGETQIKRRGARAAAI